MPAPTLVGEAGGRSRGWTVTAKAVLATLLVSVLGCAGASHAAAEAPISLTVALGYHGSVVAGWNPLSIKVANSGGDFSGSVIVAADTTPLGGPKGYPGYQGYGGFSGGCSGFNGSCSTTPTYVIPLSLAAQTSKTLSIEVIPNGTPLSVSVTDGGGAQVAQATVTTPSPAVNGGTASDVAVISDTSAPAGILGSRLLSFGRSGLGTVTWMQPSEVPGSATGLSSFAILVIENATTDGLTSEQQTALTDYVRAGGSLLILGGSHAQTIDAGLPKELLPVSVSGSTTVDSLAVLGYLGSPLQGRVAVTTMTATTGAATDVSDSHSEPLAVSAEVGSGSVEYSAVDFTTEPLLSWPGTPSLIQRYYGLSRSSAANSAAGSNLSSQLGQVADSNPDITLPSTAVVVELLVFYVLFVGPATWMILRRRKRPDLAWIAVPLISLLVTGVLYQTGWGSPVQAVMGDTINVIQVNPGSQRAQVTSVTAVFLPRGGTHQLETVAPMYIDGVDLSTQGSPATVSMGATDVIHIDNARAAFVQGFVGERYADLGGTVSLETPQARQSGPAGIVNGFHSGLTDLTFVSNAREQTVADVAAGETIRIPSGGGNDIAGGGRLCGAFGCDYSYYVPGNVQSVDDQKRQAVGQVVSTLDDGGTYFVGIADDSVLGSQVVSPDGKLRNINVVVITLLKGTAKPASPGNGLQVPNSLAPNPVNVLGVVGGGAESSDVVDLKPNQTVTDVFTLPAGQQWPSATLYLYASSVDPAKSATTAPGGGPPVLIDYLDPTTGAWLSLPPVISLDGSDLTDSVPTTAISSTNVVTLRYKNQTAVAVTLNGVGLVAGA